MRKLVVTENMTLDDVVDQLDKWFSPTASPDDINTVNREHMAKADKVLFGHTTYREFKGFWPIQTNDTTGVSHYLNRTPKYVVSSHLKQVEADWQHTIILHGQLADEIAALKNQKGTDIVLSGSLSLAQSLAREKLVDEYRLFVYPVTLGRGRRLFRRVSTASCN